MYNVKELVFFNMPKDEKKVYGSNGVSKKYSVYEIENKLSVEEKIAFIDEVKDGIASYLLNLFNKFEQEKDSLKKDSIGEIKTVSLKAWIKRNDTKSVIDIRFDIGSYYLFGTKYKMMSTICPKVSTGNYRMLYTNYDVVHQWFHDLCEELYYGEAKYFESVDTYCVKINKIKEYASWLGCLDNEIANNIYYNGENGVSEEILDVIISKYEKLDSAVKSISAELKDETTALGYEYKEDNII